MSATTRKCYTECAALFSMREMRVAACGISYFTTVTPMDLAVPMMELQMDCRGTNSLPGSVCFTCARC